MSNNTDSSFDLEERFLLAGMAAFALYTFVYSYDYEGFVGQFPRSLSIIVLVCTGLLLARNVLPEPLKTVVTQPPEMVSTDTDQETDSRMAIETKQSIHGIQIGRRELVFGTTVFYLIVSYLFGILWATPVFSLLYCYLMERSRIETIASPVLLTLIVYVFMMVTNTQRLAIGVLTG